MNPPFPSPTNGNGSMIPTWVRGMTWIISMVGFPVVVAGFLMAKDVGWIHSANHAELMRVHHELLRLTKVICVESARKNKDIAACIEQ